MFQVLLQPSPLSIFASSQTSLVSNTPFPQTEQVVGLFPSQAQPASMVHVLEQPSPSFLFVSSHCSRPSMTSFGQRLHTDGVPNHVYLCNIFVYEKAYLFSMLQFLSHPSFDTVFPSSHISADESTMPFPQIILETRFPMNYYYFDQNNIKSFNAWI